MATPRQNTNRLASLLVGLVLTSLLTVTVGWAWDGDWTQGRSGYGNDIFEDTGRSDGQAGTDPPQKFWKADPRDHANVDPEELHDYFDKRKNRDYVPYALARVEQALRYQNFILPKGYYLIKPGDANDGSPLVTMGSLQTPTENSSAPSQPGDRPASLSKRVAFYQSFVIIRQGKVLGVVPVHRMTPYKPPRDAKIPRRALAWVAWENRRPVLKFYYKKWLYETDFQ
ncbi:hypothetical protein [Vampirovibrio chlorellavorus]|uniref:hypothetical protein n=1 Tax=Vampirovibrio chlorellavorus TaxID=758823 RepID=UPI0026ED428D|nr:hypothetical protein [Vampirovibrio chlorellavorus]